jgi:hypothetical protein
LVGTDDLFIFLYLALAIGKPQAILPEETDESTENVREQKKETHITHRTTVPTIESASQNSMITCKLLFSKRIIFALLPCLENDTLLILAIADDFLFCSG